MSLEKYWQKRKFEKTPEPKGRVLKTSKKGKKLKGKYTLLKFKKPTQWLLFKTK